MNNAEVASALTPEWATIQNLGFIDSVRLGGGEGRSRANLAVLRSFGRSAVNPAWGTRRHVARPAAALKWGMRNEFTAIVERDGPWYISYCAEVPGANGQGKTPEECLSNLREAIALILENRREDSLRAMPPDAKQELVVVG